MFMRMHIAIQKEGLDIHRDFMADNAEGIVEQLQEEIAAQIGPPLSLLIRSLPPCVFVKEMITQINTGKKTKYTLPNTCEDFLLMVIEQGYASYIPEE